jgi:hypothetical protein
MLFKKNTIILLCTILGIVSLNAADKDAQIKSRLNKSTFILDPPIVENDWKFHKLGSGMWTRVTNFGKTGDDAYTGRTPSGDWPGGSGNSYLYRGSPWVTGRINGVIHSSQPEASEYSPIDSVHIVANSQRAELETYTKYYDVKAPLATGHTPLGIEVTERTYSWSESFRDDFIIYEFTIKNVGLDSDDDGYPDTPNDITEFYFTYRLDGDVSKLSDWDAEYRFSNQDDIAGVNSNWGLLDLYPDWDSTAGDFFTDDKADSTLIFMWDGDNPDYPAWTGPPTPPDDDAFNPGINGNWQTPGFLGFKILKTEPNTFKPSAFHVNNISNDPSTDQEAYDRMMAPKEFGDGLFGGHPDYSGLVVPPNQHYAFTEDYRAVLSLGPIDTLKYGDSVVVTCALGVGVDTAAFQSLNSSTAGVYSLKKLIENLDVAKLIVDSDWILPVASIPPPMLEIKEYVENGITKGLRIRWDKSSEDSASFVGYKVFKSAGLNADNQFIWQPLGSGTYLADSTNWPPPEALDDTNMYEIIDLGIKRGFDYYYSIQSISIDPFWGIIESSLTGNVQTIIPANVPTQDLNNVKVVPNPYIGSAKWNNPRPGDSSPWQHRLQFMNIPSDATIKIFTLDLDYVAEIKAGESARISPDFPAPANYGVAEWNLITRNDQEAAPGIYIYVVKSR